MVTIEKTMNEALTIRKALKSDAVSIASIHSNSWKVAHRGIVSDKVLKEVTFHKRLEYFKSILETREEESVVAEFKGLVVGFMTFGESRDADLGNNTAEIWSIYIDVSYFNKGIGTRLMEWVEKELRRRGYSNISVWVLEDNHRAIQFYRSLNYCKEVSSVVQISGENVKSARYSKNIQVL